MSSPVSSPNHWRARWQAFRHPVNGEKSELLRTRWDSLPEELKTPNQISGRHLTHCGFTTGASYCSFHCTHCYLPKNANQVPIPSLAQMREQIDANRRFQGPGGGLQLTGGDVADAYWRSGRQDELVEIVRLYAATSASVEGIFLRRTRRRPQSSATLAGLLSWSARAPARVDLHLHLVVRADRPERAVRRP